MGTGQELVQHGGVKDLHRVLNRGGLIRSAAQRQHLHTQSMAGAPDALPDLAKAEDQGSFTVQAQRLRGLVSAVASRSGAAPGRRG